MWQEVHKNIYRIPVPLPHNPLKQVNTYLLRGKRDLLIDTGFNLEICEQTLLKAFKELAVERENLDIFITHFHTDHVGLLNRLIVKETKIWCGEIPTDFISLANNKNVRRKRESLLAEFGFKVKEGDLFDSKKPEFDLIILKPKNFNILKEDDFIKVGDFNLQCIETPGHASPHMCLYEPKLKILFSSDHILNHISPNIASFQLEKNSPLTYYFNSLDKIAAMDIDLVLPAHGDLLTDYRKRIEELKIHHWRRLKETFEIVKSGPITGIEVAKCLTWDISFEAWADFPETQKFFALGETISHLNYLLEQGEISVEKREGLLYFSPNSN